MYIINNINHIQTLSKYSISPISMILPFMSKLIKGIQKNGILKCAAPAMISCLSSRLFI